MKKSQKIILSVAACVCVLIGLAGVTMVDLAHQALGVLPFGNGGTGNNTVGTNGQVLISNGSTGFSPGDPIVSFNYVTLFSAQAATGTATSSAVRLPEHSGNGTLAITGSGITGSPTGCSIVLVYQANTGTPNSGTQVTQNFTPGNSYQGFAESLALATGDQLVATYACGTYPTAGTISVVWDEALPTAVTFPLPTGTNSLGTVGVNSGTNVIGKVGIDQTTPGATNGVRTDNSGATASGVPSRADFAAGIGSGSTGGNLTGFAVGDTYKAVNISTATTTLLITGVSGRQVHISAIHLIAGAADNVALIEGTGATCGTSTAGMAGGTTAASGYNLSANGGIAYGNGLGTVIQTVTTGDSVCAVTSAAVQLSGGIEYSIW